MADKQDNTRRKAQGHQVVTLEDRIVAEVTKSLTSSYHFTANVAKLVAKDEDLFAYTVKRIDKELLAKELANAIFSSVYNTSYRATNDWKFLKNQAIKLAAEMVAEQTAQSIYKEVRTV